MTLAFAGALVITGHISDLNTEVADESPQTLPPATQLQDPIRINDFGCHGDGRHDDTACFIAARTYLEHHIRQNTITTSDGNYLGPASLMIPAGTYLITSPEALMSASFRTRTFGYHLQGSGAGITMIDYEPSQPGPLFKNNDGWLGIRIDEISFSSSLGNSDFIDSYSTGGAQDYSFSNVTWSGHWKNIFELSGSNTNSEWDWDHITISGTAKNVLDIGEIGTSDQFLNYWFRNCKIDLAHGNFITAHKGGHFKISDCDFSDIRGSGDPKKPDILFGLYGHVHSSGVTHFECNNSRFELKSNSTRVIQSEWGTFGEVSFDGVDFSSQSGSYEPVDEFDLDLQHSGGAAQYNFARSQLIGFVNIKVSNDDWGYRRNVTFQDIQFLSFDDFSSGVRFGALPQGSNYGGIPTVTCTRCRGADNNIYAEKPWKPLSGYAIGDTVYSAGYVYTASKAGTTGSNFPQGYKKVISDGTVSWTVLDRFSGSEYVQDAQLRPSVSMPSGASGVQKVAYISDGNNYNFLPRRQGPGSLGFARVILPPFSIVTKIEIVISEDGRDPSMPLDYEVSSEGDPQTIRLRKSFSNASTNAQIAPAAAKIFATGQSIESRTLILRAANSVLRNPKGWCIVYYF